MKVIKYNKLVRDKIPEIITRDDKKCTIEVLSDELYIKMLIQKLYEELDEYAESEDIEELADLYEVMLAIVKYKGYSWNELETVRANKEEKRGGFEKRLFLKEVHE